MMILQATKKQIINTRKKAIAKMKYHKNPLIRNPTNHNEHKTFRRKDPELHC